jgi:hypothetical protein
MEWAIRVAGFLLGVVAGIVLLYNAARFLFPEDDGMPH